MFSPNRFFKIISLFFLFTAALFFLTKGVHLSDFLDDRNNHPVYSKYIFEKSNDKISIGIQPLWVPANIITEIMKRDILLEKSLKSLGKEIRFYSFLKGDDVNFFLQKGDLQGGIGGDMPTINAAASMDVIIPSIVQQGFVSIVSIRYNMLEELRGKKIGYAYGSNAHFALLNALSFMEIKEKDVNLIQLDVNQMASSLAEGTIDAFCAWEPTVFQAVTKYPDMSIIHQGLTSGFLYFNRKFYDQFPEAVNRIVAAQIRAIHWIKKDYKNLITASQWTLKSLLDFTGEEALMSAQQLSNLASDDLINITEIPFVPFSYLGKNGDLKREFEFLREVGKLPKVTKWNTIKKSFDRTIIKNILRNRDFFEINNTEYKKEK